MQDLPQHAPEQVIVQQVAPSNVLKELDVKIPEDSEATKSSEDLVLNNSIKDSTDSYEKSPCSDQDKDCILQILTALAENGKLSLYFKQNELKEIGSKIEHLHPLKFLSVIFKSEDLKSRMSQFFGDYFKRNAFMGNLGSGLSTEAAKGGLTAINIENFAKEVNVPVDKIRPFFASEDWEGLVQFLINE
jgi:hypothetical protein